ncbi:branched-chain amino acid aminotransferase II [Daldinia decipiens]|uniref:branched-chain amino acid aminotransferase II n=1 Tax=Daldinia decipiens TaxID=326647 RepID=UPI0020C28441|nr:branched-chain amino acid aminotransferase II [Daldinia decipiens]KAI1653358.1 branched-chain amino acid aminotransferase II [Daldinia decipiens]
MAPSAVVTSTAHDGEQDINLTASAVNHRVNDQTASSSNGHGNGVSKPNVQELNASNITYTFTKEPRDVPAPGINSVNDSTICTDHMVTVAWSAKSGWGTPELKPYGPLSLMPTASVLHYATECFEGLKAYRGFDGKLRLFRPDCNAKRFLMSSVRISLPPFSPAEVEKLLLALMAVDGPKWLPRDRPGSFIYLRPTLIGTQSQLGVQAPSEALLYIIASYMPVMDSPVGGLKLHTSPNDMVRAWVGGFGYAKVGANYGPSLLATQEARARGFGQILWLYGSEGYCTEAGASNFFVLWKTQEGKTQLITAPLDDRLILDGVTRRSVLQLAREKLGDEIEIVERRYTIKEVLEASTEGRLLESFAAGTAFFVCPISLIHHRGQNIQIPMGKAGEGGLCTLKLKGWLKDIMYGNVDHPWGVVVQEEH